MSNQKKTETEVKKDTTSTIKFNLSKILLDDVILKFQDDVVGNEAGIYVGALDALVKKFDLSNMHYVLDKFRLANTKLLYGQKKPLTVLQAAVDETIDSTANVKGGRLPRFEVSNFKIDSVNLNYDDRLSDTRAMADFKTFNLENLFIDLTTGTYKSTDAMLANSTVDVAYRPTATNEAAIKKTADSTTESSFSLYLNKILLDGNVIKYNNLSQPHLRDRLDYNHLNIRELSIAGQDIAIDTVGIKAVLNGGKLKDSSGFVLNELKGKILYDDRQLRIDNFLLKTPQTYIENTSILNYQSKDDLSKHPERVKMSVNLRESQIHMQDIYYLVHTIPASYKREKINVAAALNGYLNNLNIDKFNLSGLKNTYANVTGNIKGLPNMNKAVFDLNINRFNTSKSDVLVFVPAKSLPATINLPNQIAAIGRFKGTTSDFNTNFDIKTDMGAAKILAAMNLAKNRERYNAKVNLNNFNIGRLLKRNDIGRVSMVANVNGTGLDAKRMNAKLKGTIYNAYYNNYTYRNIDLNGTFARQTLNLIANSKDSNANFNLTTTVGLGGKSPSVKGMVDLRQVDLQKLNFAKDELKLAGLATVDFASVDPDYLNGTALITSLQVATNGKVINMDTVSVTAFSSASENRIELISDPLTANLQGKYQLTQLGQAFINELNKYYQIGDTKKIAPQRVLFDVVLHDSKIVKELVPKINSLSPSTFSGLLDTEQDSLIVKGNISHVIYDSFNVRDVVLDINNNKPTQLDYALNIKSFESPSIRLYNSAINGTAANNLLALNVFLRDSDNKDKYAIGGNFKSLNKTYQFALDPNKLLLNYEKWMVAPDNLIQYGNAGVQVRNFNINNNSQSLAINSVPQSPNAPIKVTFKNFMLETLTRYADQDTSLVGGLLNGTVDVKDIAANPKFEASLSIDSLRYKKDRMGNAKIDVNNNRDNAFETNITLSGIHDVNINGYYYTAPTSSLDATIDIRKIDLTYIESLSGGQIKNGSGALVGKLSAKGPLTEPQLTGSLGFQNAGFTVSMLNAYYRVNNQNIIFRNGGIAFNNFTIQDTVNQPLTVNGMVQTKNYQDFAFNLDVNTRNFKVMNSTAADNKMFYGVVYLNLNAKVRGDLNKPDVNMRATINKDTKFTFVIPDNNPAVINQEGVVEFIDMDMPPNNGRDAIAVDSIGKSAIRGMDIAGDIIIDKEAQITVVVDPQNGDALTVMGEAELSLQIDPSGKTSLTGRYEISDGGYSLTVGGLAKREFKIRQGSAITWTGAPTEANVDLTAIYTANTSPMDLIADYVGEADQSTRTMYRQKMPFYVYLKMTGELLKPNIAFELDMPENERNAFNGVVYTRIQQVNANESDLNKQVFALLALNRFISDNPFQSLAGGASVNAIARQSVSRLLTQQLNNLAANLIQGVDVNFELNSGEDYSTGTEQNKTDLNIAISKRLLNDRLIVTVGNNFTLEGSTTNNQSPAQIASNVDIQYLLSRDGRYRIRAYRRNQNEGVIEGEIIETGVGFTMVVDYNRFKDVFRSFKKESERRNRKN